MPDSKISDLTAVATPAATDEFAVNQGGTSKKMTRAQVHSLESGEHLVLPQVNEAATPTLGFGDGTSGLYMGVADILSVSLAGQARFEFNGNAIASVLSDGVAILNETASTTNPTLVPNRADLDTGLGWAGADQLSFIAGGGERVRLTTNGLTAANAAGFSLVNIAATDTQISIGPNQADPNTGLGWAGADQLSLIAGGIEIMRLTEVASVVQAILPQANTAATPTLAFGDGNSGFFEGADNELGVAIAGVEKFFWTGDLLRGFITAGPALFNQAASSSSPTFIPRSNDTDTGVGSSAADNLSLIAGGIEGVRVEDPADLGATETSLWVYDLDNGTLEQVTVGAADSGGAGFKVLRIPN